MTALQVVVKRVYLAPTKGRHYLTARGAAVAEANAMLQKKYPSERPEYEGGMCTAPGYHWSSDERLLKVHKRVTRLLMRSLRNAGGKQ